MNQLQAASFFAFFNRERNQQAALFVGQIGAFLVNASRNSVNSIEKRFQLPAELKEAVRQARKQKALYELALENESEPITWEICDSLFYAELKVARALAAVAALVGYEIDEPENLTLVIDDFENYPLAWESLKA